MIQCIVCEDWFHGRHLEGVARPPKDEAYAEMICYSCCQAHQDFLLAYKGLSVAVVEKEEKINDESANSTDKKEEVDKLGLKI